MSLKALSSSILLAAFALAGCSSGRQADLARIQNADDLLEALQEVGAIVEPTELGAKHFFALPGRMVIVNNALVELHEFDSQEERERWMERLRANPQTIPAPPSGEVTPRLWGAGRLLVVYDGTEGGVVLLLSGLLGDPVMGGLQVEGEPYPPAVTRAIQSLAASLEVDPASIQVIEFKTAEWGDACLEMGAPDEDCPSELVYGWSIEMVTAGVRHRVHTDELAERIRWR